MNLLPSTWSRLVCLNVKHTIQAAGVITIAFVISPLVFSQANQGTIQGSVFDQTGGVVAGATVTIIDVARGISRALTTDSAGLYVAPNLIPGTYTVRAEAKGFRTVEHSGVVLEVGQSVRTDLVVQPGEQTQTITVTGEAPAIDTTDTTLGGTIDQQELATLPMNGRNFKNLLSVRPGVTGYVGGGEDTWSANGTRPEEIGYLIDGLRADETYLGSSLVNSTSAAGDSMQTLPLDAIQEANIEANPKAEFGWKPGAIINVGLKSGTNSLHGTAFAYGRDTSFDARNVFNQAPQTKDPVELEQFGGSAGGRIIKDKLFWYAAYEEQRYTVGNLNPSSTPATSSLGGCTIASPAGCGDTSRSLVDACLDLNHTGKVISPLSAQISGLNAGTCAVAPANYSAGPSESLYPTNPTGNPIFLGLLNTQLNDNGMFKIDYHANDHNTVNGMYYIGEGGITSFTAPVLGLPGTGNSPFMQNFPATAQLGSGAWNWAPSSTRVNELRIGYSHYYQPWLSLDHNINPLAYGINTGVTNPLFFGFPQINITGFDRLGGKIVKIVGPEGNLQLLEHYSIVHGDHTFKFGGEFINTRIHTQVFQGAGAGTIAFGSLENFLQGNVKNSGSSIASGDPTRLFSNDQYALFAQDDWRATRRVTVNLGLRWEYNSVPSETHNLFGGFDPTQGLVQVGKQIQAPFKGDFKDFSPRLGVAWDIRGNGKTVLRAGGSLMYSYLPFLSYIQGLAVAYDPTGAGIVTLQTGPAGAAGSGTIVNAAVTAPGTALTPGWKAQTAACVSGGTAACGPIFPASVFSHQCGDGLINTNGSKDPLPCSIATVSPNLHSARIGTWTVGLQRVVTNSLSLDLSYVGTHGSDIVGIVDINQAPTGSGFMPIDILVGDPSASKTCCGPGSEQASRPFYKQFPYLSFINQIGNIDRSNYHALQVTLTQRSWHGLSFLAGYTYSHALDDASTNEFDKLPLDSTNPTLQYATSDFDVRHRFTLSTTYVLPGKKSPGQMLEGWAVNSVVTLQGGGPWSPLDLSDDISGTNEVHNGSFGQWWNYSGPIADFTAGSNPVSCWSGFGGASLAGCDLTGATPPAPCLAAATAKGPNTVAALNSVGCYVFKGNSVLFPPALGTYGNAGRNIFLGPPYRNWDFSVTKNWKFTERYHAELKVEFFNILNHPIFTNPGGIGTGAGFNDPSAGGGGAGQFGCGCITPDQASPDPILGSGGSRSMQLGLRLFF